MLEAEVRVPPVATVFPGQGAGEGGQEVEEHVGDNHVVVDGHQAHDEQHGRTGTCGGQGRPSGQGSHPPARVHPLPCLPQAFNIAAPKASPLKSGLIFQTARGPRLENWPRESSRKKRGMPQMASMRK